MSASLMYSSLGVKLDFVRRLGVRSLRVLVIVTPFVDKGVLRPPGAAGRSLYWHLVLSDA